MDGSRFDELTKSLTAQRSRRGVLGALAASALAAVGARRAEAARLRAVGNSCVSNADCASGFCVQESRTRKICHCQSNGDCPGGVCLQTGACCTPVDPAVTCAGKCGPQTDNCGQAVDCGPCCLAPEAACAGDSDCCSGICAAGICAAGPVLDGGACDSDTDCQNGHCCSGVCRNFKTDTSNCGFCGNVCSTNHLTGVACSDGLCVGTCDAGYADCDGNKLTNGCEVDLSTDHDNCGACGAICRVGETCVAGVCQCGANPRCDAHEACVNDVCFDACAPFTGGATNSAKCVTDCGETFGDSCIAGPESAICVAVYGTISCDPCDRDAECPGGYCMAWQYGSQLYKTNETCGVGASKGVCATFLYVCPEGGAV